MQMLQMLKLKVVKFCHGRRGIEKGVERDLEII
jgi:hypothetical protein